MKPSMLILTIIDMLIFVILTFLGVVFIMASPVNPSTTVVRLLVGVILIIVALIILVVFSLLIQKSKYKIIKIKGEKKQVYTPAEIVCKNCGTPIVLTEEIKKKDEVICESCGKVIVIPRDTINW